MTERADPAAPCRHEEQLVAWLHSLQLLRESEAQRGFASAVAPHLPAGVLLCDIVSVVTGAPVPGVTSRPVTAAARQGNIARALAAVKVAPGMNRRWAGVLCVWGGAPLPGQGRAGQACGQKGMGAFMAWLRACSHSTLNAPQPKPR
jgi:hypothetical protein